MDLITFSVSLLTPHHTVLNIGRVILVSNETNTDVHTYIKEFILVDVISLLYKEEVIWNENHSNNRRERMRLLSEVQLTHWN